MAPESFTTLAQRTISLFTKLPNSSGDVPIGATEPGTATDVIHVPADYASLRAADPARAADERARVGAALAAAFADGARLGLAAAGYAVVRP